MERGVAKKPRYMANNSDCTVIEFLNAEHGAAIAGTHHQIYSGGPPPYVPGYLDMVDGWLRAHQTAAIAP